MKAAFLFLLSLASAGTPYQVYGRAWQYIYACQETLESTAAFCEDGELIGQLCGCTNSDYLATFAGCMAISKRNSTRSVQVFLNDCNEKMNTSLTQQDFQEAYINYTKYAQSTLDIPDFNISVPVTVPVQLNETIAHYYKVAYKEFLGNYDWSLFYGAGLLGYWALVMLIATIANWSQYIFPGFVQKFTGPISNKWRKHVTLPATLGRRKTQAKPFLYYFSFLVPSRFESLVIFGFTVVMIACSSAQIVYYRNDPVFTHREGLLRYTADRTGILATMITPLLILFGGRNNFMQFFTNWNFATFVTYHRWIARLMFVLIFIHAVTFSVGYADYKIYYSEMKEAYLIWATIATVAGGFMLVQSMLYLRRKWYETFLLVHYILGTLFLAGSWIHVNDLGYSWFYYGASAVWVLNAAIRIARLSLFGAPKAEVVLLADETLRVTVSKPSYWYATPGGFAFVHFLRPSCFWQSHPFTFTQCDVSSDTITFYCKVKGGVTHGLYQYLQNHPGKTAQIRVAVEGPYGSASAARKYDTAVFVAGGNGIPGIYAEAFDLAKRTPSTVKQTLKLVWVVRDYRSLLWFYQELNGLKDTRIDTTVYVTRPDVETSLEEFKLRNPITSESDNDKAEKEIEKISDAASEYDSNANVADIIKSELNHVTFIEGRPNVEELVLQETQESSGSIAFVTCGNPIMVDDIRYAVVQNLDKSEGKRIEFFEQLQVWA